MRMLLAAVALATLAGSPALAQSYTNSVGSGNIAQPWFARSVTPSVERPTHVAPRATSRSSGRLYLYSGDRARTDVDPNLQFQLHRESQQGEW